MYTLVKKLNTYYLQDDKQMFPFTLELIEQIKSSDNDLDDFLGEVNDGLTFDIHEGEVITFNTVVCPFQSEIYGETCTTCNCTYDQQDECAMDI